MCTIISQYLFYVFYKLRQIWKYRSLELRFYQSAKYWSYMNDEYVYIDSISSYNQS